MITMIEKEEENETICMFKNPKSAIFKDQNNILIPDYLNQEIDFEKKNHLINYHRISKIRKRTLKYKKLLTNEVYHKSCEIVVKFDLLKGRKIENVIEQVARLLILSKINSTGIFNFDELEFLFSIKPNFKIIREIIKLSKDISVKKENLVPNNDYFLLKDINFANKVCSEKNCRLFYSLLKDFYIHYPKKFNKEGNLPALIYMAAKKRDRKQSQSQLAYIFEITEVTIRTRWKEIQRKNGVSDKLLETIGDLFYEPIKIDDYK
jgi:hypothetical protein